jgi:hypothetical protein
MSIKLSSKTFIPILWLLLYAQSSLAEPTVIEELLVDQVWS